MNTLRTYSNPFWRPHVNRRPVPRAQKPLIRKLIGVPTWICYLHHHGACIGFGLSPAEAYDDWKRRQL
jgi:hypothetical protein